MSSSNPGRRAHVERRLSFGPCDPTVFGDVILTVQTPPPVPIHTMDFPVVLRHEHISLVPLASPKPIKSANTVVSGKLLIRSFSEGAGMTQALVQGNVEVEKRRASALVDELLAEIYAQSVSTTDYNSGTSSKSQRNSYIETLSEDALRSKGL